MRPACRELRQNVPVAASEASERAACSDTPMHAAGAFCDAGGRAQPARDVEPAGMCRGGGVGDQRCEQAGVAWALFCVHGGGACGGPAAGGCESPQRRLGGGEGGDQGVPGDGDASAHDPEIVAAARYGSRTLQVRVRGCGGVWGCVVHQVQVQRSTCCHQSASESRVLQAARAVTCPGFSQLRAWKLPPMCIRITCAASVAHSHLLRHIAHVPWWRWRAVHSTAVSTTAC